MRFTFLHVRTNLAWVVGELVLVAALIALATWLSYLIQDRRRQIVTVQAQVDRQLAGAGETAALKTIVDERRADVDSLLSYIPPEDDIGGVVAVLEGEATKRGLTLQIPVVEEVTDEAEQGNGGAGELKDVRLSVVVTGPPRQALQFFHAAEHLPYLTAVSNWKFSADQTIVVPQIQVSAPDSVPLGGPAGGLSSQTASAAELTLDLYLTIRP